MEPVGHGARRPDLHRTLAALRAVPRAGSLRLDRGLLVRQDTGEDWAGVHLLLSTARPMDQSAPSELQPQFPRIGAQEALTAASVTWREHIARETLATSLAIGPVDAGELAKGAVAVVDLRRDESTSEELA